MVRNIISTGSTGQKSLNLFIKIKKSTIHPKVESSRRSRRETDVSARVMMFGQTFAIAKVVGVVVAAALYR